METQTVRHKKSPSTRGWWALCLMKIAMGVVGLLVDVMRRWCQAVIFAFPLLTALREGKVLRLAEGVTHSRIMGRNGLVEIIRLSITPSANRNSCRVARLVGVDTQGSVLRPQPWAGETQLRQSCCCLRRPLPMPSESPSPALPKGREPHWRPLPSPPQGAGAPSCCV